MMAPGLPDIALKYDITNTTIIALTLSIFLLSFAIGPLILGPLSEMYGRTWVCPRVSPQLRLTASRCCTSPTCSSSVSTSAVPWHQLPALLLVSASSVRPHPRPCTTPQLKPYRWLCRKCANRLWWRQHKRPLRREGPCICHGTVHSWASDR